MRSKETNMEEKIRRAYEKPDADICKINKADIITASGNADPFNIDDDEEILSPNGAEDAFDVQDEEILI